MREQDIIPTDTCVSTLYTSVALMIAVLGVIIVLVGLVVMAWVIIGG